MSLKSIAEFSFDISQMSNILNLLVDVEELEDPATRPVEESAADGDGDDEEPKTCAGLQNFLDAAPWQITSSSRRSRGISRRGLRDCSHGCPVADHHRLQVQAPHLPQGAQGLLAQLPQPFSHALMGAQHVTISAWRPSSLNFEHP